MDREPLTTVSRPSPSFRLSQPEAVPESVEAIINLSPQQHPAALQVQICKHSFKSYTSRDDFTSNTSKTILSSSPPTPSQPTSSVSTLSLSPPSRPPRVRCVVDDMRDTAPSLKFPVVTSTEKLKIINGDHPITKISVIGDDPAACGITGR